MQNISSCSLTAANSQGCALVIGGPASTHQRGHPVYVSASENDVAWTVTWRHVKRKHTYTLVLVDVVASTTRSYRVGVLAGHFIWSAIEYSCTREIVNTTELLHPTDPWDCYHSLTKRYWMDEAIESFKDKNFYRH